ncbi:choline uptake/conversion transcriptional regulator CudC [Bacillus sp. SD088]|uniref:choline uptake/conversion transcriptional regulator CudC n=1 Tax=Bacillus sp. SD088 TaxID=2782012 RepID=UPI001A96B2E2|nr:GbsR/MarR family transcriptional regulator [Bacillus sp. SD088]MBO0993286.1 GbsR/MarR family transcriptional regulator [Bacillus sp. SD088]
MNSQDDQAREKIADIKNKVIGAISETMDLYGVAPSAGTLYATMYFNNEMNLDEMREELNMSKPSMSTGVRKLQENGMVKRIYQRGSRKHLYVAEKDFFESFVTFYKKMWDREVRTNLNVIIDGEKILNDIIASDDVSAETKDIAKEYIELFEESKIYYKWLGRLSDTIRSGEIFEFLPKEEKQDKDEQQEK